MTLSAAAIGLSILLYVAACVGLFQVSKLVGGRAWWILLVLAIGGLALDRVDALVRFLQVGSSDHLREDLVGLGIALLAFAGIFAVRPVLQRLEDMRRQIEKSEERFRSLVLHSSDLIIVVGEDGTIEYESPALEPMLGYAPEERRGGSIFDLVHPDDRDRSRRILEELLRNGDDLSPFEVRIRHRDGSWRVLETVASNRLRDPAVRGLVMNCRDITDQLNAAEALRETRKLEAVGRLAGGVAHDFNNLLTVIKGYADGLAQRAVGEEAEDLEEIREAATRGAALTRQLLAFGRRQPVRPRRLDLNRAVGDGVEMLGSLLGARTRVAFVPGADLGTVEVDPGLVEQVLVSLATNARDAMPDGGTVTFSTRNESVREDQITLGGGHGDPGEYVVVDVTDEGKGMDEATRARVFEPFFTTKEQGQGTGLGLATVYGAARQSGGWVQVQSAPGKGSTFSLYLPRVEGGVPEPESQVPSSEGPHADVTVLVVEDEEPLRRLFRAFLEPEGYRVLLASGGAEATERVAEVHGEIDILLLDVRMPGETGPELAKRLLPEVPGSRVLYMSGYTDDALGFDGSDGEEFLAKPFDRAALLETIDRLLSR